MPFHAFSRRPRLFLLFMRLLIRFWRSSRIPHLSETVLCLVVKKVFAFDVRLVADIGGGGLVHFGIAKCFTARKSTK